MGHLAYIETYISSLLTLLHSIALSRLNLLNISAAMSFMFLNKRKLMIDDDDD